jgi:hypothetical protein
MSAVIETLFRRISLALIGLGVLVVLVALGTTIPFADRSFAVRGLGTYVIGALGLVCFLVGIGMAVHEHVRSQPLGVTRSPFGQPLTVSAYPPGQAFRYYEDMRALVGKADDVKLISMGLQILWVGNMLDVLVDRARKGAKVTVCMANPYNPAVLHRLIEEEMFEIPPQVRRKGIEGNIQTLLSRLDGESSLDTFRFCLFEHYPTLATYIADHNVFVAPYTYQRLGSDAPVLHLRNDGRDPVARFIVENAERTLRDAVPAAEVMRARRDRRHFSAEWIQACVAIVPTAEEPLYRFGSFVVGFDLWTGGPPSGARRRPRPLANAVGDASGPGFHAPIVGPLYFMHSAEIRRVVAGLTVMADEFHRLTLTHLRIEDRSDGGGGIVLACDDESGVVEALHNELVAEVNRSATSSDFLAKRVRVDAGTGLIPRRSSLMIGRYATPCVFKKYDLCFPLCALPPRDRSARAQLVQLLEGALRAMAPSDHLDAEQVHLLVKRRTDSHWKVDRSFHLGAH